MLWLMDRFLRVEDEFFVTPHTFEDKIRMLLLCLFSRSLSLYGLIPNVVLYKIRLLMRPECCKLIDYFKSLPLAYY